VGGFSQPRLLDVHSAARPSIATVTISATIPPTMDLSPRLRVIACGGTFDKRYNPISGVLEFGESQMVEILARARVTLSVAVETLMQVDSLDMHDEHRERVLAACRAAREPWLVIVHGTDTMSETARTLGPHFGVTQAVAEGVAASDDTSKTIVLTGAMVAYSISKSDALFNLGFACAAAQTLAPGVWIAMNGRVFAWDAVRKNRDEGVFEPIA